MTEFFPMRRDAIVHITNNALAAFPYETTLAGNKVYAIRERRIDLNDQPDSKLVDLINYYVSLCGDDAMLMFPDQGSARAYCKKHRPDLVGYGLRRGAFEWFMLRPENAGAPGMRRSEQKDAPKRAQGGAPTAKSICLSIYQQGTTERDAFVAEAVLAGVKEVTAKTMFSDIKSGRIK